MNFQTFQIKLSDEEAKRFQDGHAKSGVYESVESLMRVAACTGLSTLEKIDFDITGAIAAASRRPVKKGGRL